MNFNLFNTPTEIIDAMMVLHLSNSDILSIIRDDLSYSTVDSNIVLDLAKYMDMNKEEFNKFMDSGISSRMDVDNAKQLCNLHKHLYPNGHVFELDQYTLLIKDEDIIKYIPCSKYGNYNPIVPMYLISKYPQSKKLQNVKNTSLFMRKKYGIYIKQFVLDNSIISDLQYTQDFTDYQLTIVDWNVIILCEASDRICL